MIRKEYFWKGVGVGMLCFLLYKFVMKDSLIGVISKNLSFEEAGVLRGVLLGDKAGFSKSFYEKLIDSGLVHLMVASGTNVMLLSRFFIEKMAYWVGRKTAIVFGLGVLWWYTSMLDYEAPILRAVLLISVFYAAQLLGRRFNLSRALVFSVGLMLLVKWSFVKEYGFWLSFISFGVLLLKERFWVGRKLSGVWGESLWLSVWLSPILALMFGRVSLVGVLSNVLVVFLVEIVSVLGVLGLFLSLVSLEKVVFWLLYPVLRYVVEVVNWAGSFSFGVWELRVNWLLVLGLYMLLVFGLRWGNEKKRA